MSLTYKLGHFMAFRPTNGDRFRFQNFFIGESVVWETFEHQFAPFGFAGFTASRQGDNVESQLVFPNNAITRAVVLDAVEGRWPVRVHTVQIDEANNVSLLNRYVGQVASGAWDETAVALKLNSAIDAVTNTLPRRSLNEQLVGSLPITSRVSV